MLYTCWGEDRKLKDQDTEESTIMLGFKTTLFSVKWNQAVFFYSVERTIQSWVMVDCWSVLYAFWKLKLKAHGKKKLICDVFEALHLKWGQFKKRECDTFSPTPQEALFFRRITVVASTALGLNSRSRYSAQDSSSLGKNRLYSQDLQILSIWMLKSFLLDFSLR